MPKRKTRSTSANPTKNVGSSETIKKKRCSVKKLRAGKVLFDEEGSIVVRDCEPAATAVKVASECDKNFDSDSEDSSTRLMIDLGENQDEVSLKTPISTLSTKLTTVCFENDTAGGVDKNQRCSSTISKKVLVEQCDVETDSQISIERPCQQDRTPVVNRSTAVENNRIIQSQSSTPRIVVSVDRHRHEANEEISRHYRTSTPIRPSQFLERDLNTLDDDLNCFSIETIPQETYAILSRFQEFRRLVKAYNAEKKKCLTWVRDYARLQKDHKRLSENSFARPSPPALAYLVELLTCIQKSSGRDDPRTDQQLAEDLNINLMVLLGMRDDSPQQTALNIFNHLHPGYKKKVELDTLDKWEEKKAGILDTVLVFAQRSAPGSIFKMQELRTCLSNSIRGARYNFSKANNSLALIANALAEGNENHMHAVDGSVVREDEYEPQMHMQYFSQPTQRGPNSNRT